MVMSANAIPLSVRRSAPLSAFLILGFLSACSGSKPSEEQSVPVTAPAAVAPASPPVLVRPAPARMAEPEATPASPAVAAAPAAAAPAPPPEPEAKAVAPAAPTAATAVAVGGAVDARPRVAAATVQEAALPKVPGERFLVGRIQAGEQLVDEAAQARDEIIRQLAQRPQTSVFSDEEISKGRELARRANPKCDGEACLPTVALLLNADALITGSLAREHHEYVLTINVARARAPHPATPRGDRVGGEPRLPIAPCRDLAEVLPLTLCLTPCPPGRRNACPT
jgi:hypothetical protein